MKIIIAFTFLIFGYFIGSFGIIQMLTIIRFSIPYTHNLNSQNVINRPDIIIKNNVRTIFFWSSITVVSTILIYLFASPMCFYAYIIGTLISIILGYGFTGRTESNIEEYVKNYGHFITLNDENLLSTLLFAEQLEKINNSIK